MSRDRLRRLAIRRVVRKTADDLGAPIPHTHPGMEVRAYMSPFATATRDALWSRYLDALDAENRRLALARIPRKDAA